MVAQLTMGVLPFLVSFPLQLHCIFNDIFGCFWFKGHAASISWNPPKTGMLPHHPGLLNCSPLSKEFFLDATAKSMREWVGFVVFLLVDGQMHQVALECTKSKYVSGPSMTNNGFWFAFIYQSSGISIFWWWLFGESVTGVHYITIFNIPYSMDHCITSRTEWHNNHLSFFYHKNFEVLKCQLEILLASASGGYQ